MKNIEILNLVESLNSNIDELKKLRGAKFAYAIIKNLELLGTEAKLIQSIYTVSDEYKEYDKTRIDICERYAQRNEAGEVIKNWFDDKSFEYKLDTTNQEFLKEIEELTTKFNTVLKENNDKSVEYNKFLMEESLIKFVDIDINSVPEDITVELLSIIKPFIKD